MYNSPTDLPMLDAHAHIAPDVTAAQLRSLRSAQVFAMTRTLAEAAYALRRTDASVVWGVGVHPGRPDALESWDPRAFESHLESTWLVGEIGLDRRGDQNLQEKVLDELLSITSEGPWVLSIHSSGRQGAVLELLRRRPQRAAVLHWFTGSESQLEAALEVRCYFSINAAMSEDQISRIPIELVLPETDFPSSKRQTGATVPGDILSLERRLAGIHGLTPDEVRSLWYRNLGTLANQGGVGQKLSPNLQRHIETASGLHPQ